MPESSLFRKPPQAAGMNNSLSLRLQELRARELPLRLHTARIVELNIRRSGLNFQLPLNTGHVRLFGTPRMTRENASVTVARWTEFQKRVTAVFNNANAVE